MEALNIEIETANASENPPAVEKPSKKKRKKAARKKARDEAAAAHPEDDLESDDEEEEEEVVSQPPARGADDVSTGNLSQSSRKSKEDSPLMKTKVAAKTTPLRPTMAGHVMGGQKAIASYFPIGSQAKLCGSNIWGDMQALVKGDTPRWARFKHLVLTVLDYAGISSTSSGYEQGKELTMKQFSCSMIFSLEKLGDMNAKSIVQSLNGVEGIIVSAAIDLGMVMRLDAGANIWKALGIPLINLTAKNFRYVKQSHESMILFPITASAEDFQRIPSPNEVNIFIVKNNMDELLSDNNLTHIIDAKRVDLKQGKHFFQNRWLAQKILARIRKTSSSHIMELVTFNGADAYDTLFATYLKPDKVDTLVRRLKKGLDDLRLRRVGDVHGFFSAINWYIKAILALDGIDGWPVKEQERQVMATLGASRLEVKSDSVLSGALS